MGLSPIYTTPEIDIVILPADASTPTPTFKPTGTLAFSSASQDPCVFFFILLADQVHLEYDPKDEMFVPIGRGTGDQTGEISLMDDKE